MSRNKGHDEPFGKPSLVELDTIDLFGERIKVKGNRQNYLCARAVLWAKNEADYSTINPVWNKSQAKYERVTLANCKLVLYELAATCSMYGNKKTPAYVAYPREDTLADAAQMSIKTLRKVLKALRDAQLIARIQRLYKGRYQATITVLLVDHRVILPSGHRVMLLSGPEGNFTLYRKETIPILRKGTHTLQVARTTRDREQDTPKETSPPERTKEGEDVRSGSGGKFRPIHSLWIKCNQLHHDREVSLTDKERGNLTQWADKIQALGYEPFLVMDEVVAQWDVFTSFARADEGELSYRVNHPL